MLCIPIFDNGVHFSKLANHQDKILHPIRLIDSTLNPIDKTALSDR